MVVDDDALCRASLCDILGAAGFATCTALNGSDALNQFQRGASADLIVLDLVMPVMDGWQFLQTQQIDPFLVRIPTIVVSGIDYGPGAFLSYDRVMVRCFPKPLHVPALLSSLHNLCPARPAAQPISMPAIGGAHMTVPSFTVSRF